jgi:DNA-binding NarL/FixJ family response regulator
MDELEQRVVSIIKKYPDLTPEDIASALFMYSNDLPKRHIDCLKLLVSGMTYEEIAKKLNHADDTIKNWVNDLKNKFEVNSKEQLAALAIYYELVSLQDILGESKPLKRGKK